MEPRMKTGFVTCTPTMCKRKRSFPNNTRPQSTRAFSYPIVIISSCGKKYMITTQRRHTALKKRILLYKRSCRERPSINKTTLTLTPTMTLCNLPQQQQRRRFKKKLGRPMIQNTRGEHPASGGANRSYHTWNEAFI
eukprot:scaffold1511_cov170-Amphora_coffeaeformis.AAC.8